MLERNLILITGRSTKQGTGISAGKTLEEYQAETRILKLNAADMARLGFNEDDLVKVRSPHGEAIAACHAADLPEGLAFMAYGPVTSLLIGDETHASGMPDSKGLVVELERVPA